MKIISGGQTGADLGGIEFAIESNIENEINICKKFEPKCGFPDTKINVITETKGIPGLCIRRKYNIKNSDITIIFLDKDLYKTRGSLATYNEAKMFKKPCFIVRLYDTLEIIKIQIKSFISYIKNNKVNIINIAGSITCNQNLVKVCLRIVFKK